MVDHIPDRVAPLGIVNPTQGILMTPRFLPFKVAPALTSAMLGVETALPPPGSSTLLPSW